MPIKKELKACIPLLITIIGSLLFAWWVGLGSPDLKQTAYDFIAIPISLMILYTAFKLADILEKYEKEKK